MRIFFLFLIPVLFVIHMIAAVFSPGIRKQIKQHQMLHVGWFIISLAVAVLAFAVIRGS